MQNTVDYADLGAATSGVTFFRTHRRLVRRVDLRRDLLQPAGQRAGRRAARGHAAAAASASRAAQANPSALNSSPPPCRDAILHAYSLALHPVFLAAIPLAVIAFVLSWFLREVPLRTPPVPWHRRGLGEGLAAAPPERSSVDEVERSLVRLASTDIRRRGYERLAALAGLDLPAGSCWILTRLAKQGTVRSEDLARQANVTVDYGRPFADRLVAEGMVVRTDGALVLTDAGRAAAERLFTARREGLRELLADWSPEEYAELGDLLTKLSRALLGDDADRNLIASTSKVRARPKP